MTAPAHTGTRRSARLRLALVVALGAASLAGCSGASSFAGDDTTPGSTRSSTEPASGSTSTPPNPTSPPPKVDPQGPRVGAEVLADRDFDILRGRSVGAIVNQTSLIRTDHNDTIRLVDALAATPQIDLRALFAPEHGIDGLLAAGEPLTDSVDAATGVAVFSLYGSTRRPTAAMFEGLDAVVFDLQDVGSRSYTYISTMGLAMQTAAATGTTFVVLDRPNPLGGELVSGFTLEPVQSSFIGMYPMPQIHGLTVGEVATMIVGEAWLPGLDDLDLIVVDVEGWSRRAQWPDLGLTWVAPSPRLATPESAFFYAGTVLLAGTSISDGSGTPTPFTSVGAPFVTTADDLAHVLTNQRTGSGVAFLSTRFTPEAIPGVSPEPLFEGITVDGVAMTAADWSIVDPVTVAVTLLTTLRDLPGAPRSIVVDGPSLDRVAGTAALRDALDRGDTAARILQAMSPSVEAFRQLRRPYLRYE